MEPLQQVRVVLFQSLRFLCRGGFMNLAVLAMVGILLLYLISVINVLNEYERAVVFRLGRILEKSKDRKSVV